MLSWMMVLAMAVMAGTGCTKRARVNLDGLDQNAPGSKQAGLSHQAGSGFEGQFENVQLVPVTDGQGGQNGWNDLDKPVMAGDAAGAFVQNGQYYAEKVYFDYNRSEVRPSERPKLEALATHLLNNPGTHVVIEGHCDERGSDEYNRALSERRSLAVQDYLVSLGVDSATMRTVSYGEDKPEVKEASTEAEHQLNRRAQFLVGMP